MESSKLFPDLVFKNIIKYLSAYELLICSEVCRQWRFLILESSRWYSFQFGHNVNIHQKIPTFEFFSSFSHGFSEIVLTQSVPFFTSDVVKGLLRRAVAQRFCNINLLLLDDLMSRCNNLRKLDMSDMDFSEDNELALEDIWSRVHISDNAIESLSFPIGTSLTNAHLRSLIDKHPRLKHLSFSTSREDLCMDKGDYPLGVFNTLKSLKMDVSNLFPSGLPALLSLRSCYQLHSLAIVKSVYLIDRDVFGPRMEKDIVTCLMQLNIMGNLVNLHLGIALTYVDVALVFFNCSKLITFRGDFVDADAGREGLSKEGVRSLSLSATYMPQMLQSVHFGLLPYDISQGLMGLMELLLLCNGLTSVEFHPQSESGDLPIELMLTPETFLQGGLDRHPLLPLIAALFFFVPTKDDWLQLRTILGRMPNLDYLAILLDEAGEEDSLEGDGLFVDDLRSVFSREFEPNAITNLHLTLSNFGVFPFLKTVLQHWSSIKKLSICTPHHESFPEDVIFGELLGDFPGNLEQLTLYLNPLILSCDCVEKTSQLLARMTHLDLAIVEFGHGAFEALTRSCPLLKTLKIGCEKALFSFLDCNAYLYVSGLVLGDLSHLSYLSALERCLLIVDVPETGVDYLPEKVLERPPGVFVDYPEMFIRLKDVSPLNQLIKNVKRFPSLDSLEIIASVYNYNSASKKFYPLFYSNRCCLGRLHFMSAKSPILT